MIIEKNKVVTLDYSLYEKEPGGQLIEETFGKDPLVFIFGIGMMIPAFEANLMGKATGEEFSFGIKSEQAYGPRAKEAVVEVPIENFAVDGKIDRDKLQVGVPLQVQDQKGHMHQGVIVKVGINTIMVDFNHPMAGVDLYFKGKIKSIREATQEELDHGHVHGPGGHHH